MSHDEMLAALLTGKRVEALVGGCGNDWTEVVISDGCVRWKDKSTLAICPGRRFRIITPPPPKMVEKRISRNEFTNSSIMGKDVIAVIVLEEEQP